MFLNSNGMLLTLEIHRALDEAGLISIHFGIDAAEPGMHKKSEQCKRRIHRKVGAAKEYSAELDGQNASGDAR